MIGTRDVLGRNATTVGVVAEAANAYGRSVAAGLIVPTNSALTFAEGMAVRARRHGQSLAFAGARAGVAVTIVVP